MVDHRLLLRLKVVVHRVLADTRLSWLTLTPPYRVEILGKGRKWRTCPLGESTAGQLRQLIKERRPKPGANAFLFLNRFGHPFSRSGIADLLKRHIAKASVTMPERRKHRISPHTVRHTTAMPLLQSGVELNVIRSWLGHASTTTTNGDVEFDLTMKRKALETCEFGSSQDTEASWQSQPDILSWLESL
jgi:integrase/recombinase XerD